MNGSDRKDGFTRRDFLRGGVMATVSFAAAQDRALAVEEEVQTPPVDDPAVRLRPDRLIASAPVLQNAAETSIGVAFAVSADASGWVDVSTSPDMARPSRFYSGGSGVMDVNDKVALVRVKGLKPATCYWYRVGADRIDYQGGYKMKNLGSEVDETVHSFMTLGERAEGSFCVINDTHESKDALDAVFSKIREIKPAVVIWNGDASNCSDTIDKAMEVFIRPHENHPSYAADTPYMFLNGNHDFRGRFNRRLGDLMMWREAAERRGEYAELGRNFVQRLGDIALIGLDTGEDKLDSNPIFAGIFRMKEYRELQTRWLAEEIEKPAIKTAKFKVVFCHIPLFDSRPRANPGDLAPADVAKRYSGNYAAWQRTCARMWTPLFEKAGVQLVVCAHQHRFRYDPPAGGRTWAQIVGGGPAINPSKIENCPTLIEGRVGQEGLHITVHSMAKGQIIFNEVFA